MAFVAPKEKTASFDTPLDEREEAAFADWKAKTAPNDSGFDYDLRGAYKAGLAPGADGHWPDTYKKPNHPTFSVESVYAKDAPHLAGRWQGETYIKPGTTAGGFVAPAASVAAPDTVADDFDEITFAAQNAANPRSVDFAYGVYADRAKRGFKDAAGKPYRHYNPSMTVGDVAQGFGSFVRGVGMAVPRLFKQAGQAAIGSPNAATTTAENIVGVQMAGKNLERLTGAEPNAPEVLPAPVAPTPLGVLLDNEGKLQTAELEKVKAAIEQSPYAPAVKEGAWNAVRSLEGGMLGADIPNAQIADLNRIMELSHPARETALRGAADDASLRQQFDNILLSAKENLQLGQGQPIDRGIVAGAIKERAGEGVPTSELFSPQALRDMGAEPVDVDAARAVAAAADPGNLALMKVPGLPFARKAGGALAQGLGKTLEGVGALGGKARPTLRAVGATAGVMALANGNPEQAAAIGAALAGRWGLRKIGQLGKFIAAAGKEARVGMPSPTSGALAEARRAGALAPGLTAKNAAQNAIIDAAAMPVGALPINAMMSHGDMETFWAMEAGSPLFGAFGVFNPIKPQLVNAIRPQLRAEGKTRFDSFAKGDKWQKASKAMVERLPVEQQNAVYEIAAVLSGLDTGGGQQSDIIPLSAADYAAAKAEFGYGAGQDRGFTHEGKAYVNAEHASAKAPGELAHTAGHEAGGHVAAAILRASTAKGGLLYGKTVQKIKNELGVEKGGKFEPTPEFAEFIKQYNEALIKGGSPKEAQIAPNDPAAVEEWIAETAGNIFRQGGGDVVIPEGLRDKMGNAVGKLFGENLGIEGNFGHQSNAKITSAWMDALRQISDPAVRRMTLADSPAQEAATEQPAAPEPAPPALDPQANARRDTELALVALGWPKTEAKKAASAAQGATTEELLKNALAGVTAKPAPPITGPSAPLPPPGPQNQATAPQSGALAGGIEAAKPPVAGIAQPALAPNEQVGQGLPVTTLEPPPQSAEQISLDARNKAAADLKTQLDRGALSGGIKPAEAPVAPAKAPAETSPADVAVEERITKAGGERLPAIFDIATQIAQNDPALFQRRTDKRGKVSHSGRLNFDLPEHRALAKELGWSPEETARIKQAQESAGKVAYVDYWSADNLDPGDITGAQRKAEYEADKGKKSRAELQKNKAIIFTNVAAFPKGKAIQRGISVDKYLANAAKLLRAAEEHGLGVDYSGINDPNILEDLNGYVENHKNGYKGDGSGPVKGEVPPEGYEPYLIPRARFDLLNAAFHMEGSTASARLKARQAAHAADVAAWEAGGKKGRKPTKPSLRAETREAEADTQALARENDWFVDDATGDTNPFRAFLNREGKLEFKNPETGALRKGTTENLESVFEALSPDMIAAIRDNPNGPQDTVRGVGFQGDTGGVLSKGLPDFGRVGAGFMPDTPQFKEWFGKSKATDESGAPKVYYHGTLKNRGEFNEFKGGQTEKDLFKLSFDGLGPGWFTDNQAQAQRFGDRVVDAYVKLEKPLILEPDPWAQEAYMNGRARKQELDRKFEAGEYMTPQERKERDRLKTNDGTLGNESDRFADPFAHLQTLAREAQIEYPELSKGAAIREALKKSGYDGIILRRTSADTKAAAKETNEWVIPFDGGAQIKSATGNTGAFDPKNPDIRFMPSTEPRAIKEAAVKLEDGRVFTGATHFDAMLKAAQADGTAKGDKILDYDGWAALESEIPAENYGFVTNAGEYLTRPAALTRARDMGQYKGKGTPSETGGAEELEADRFNKQQKGALSGGLKGDDRTKRSGGFMPYAGPNAKTYPEAKKKGVLFEGLYDKKTRFEIGNDKLDWKIGAHTLETGKSYKLGELIKHPDLFRAYPDMADIDVVISDKHDTAAYRPTEDKIFLPSDREGDQTPSIIHEIQHAIQERENFASGARGGGDSYWYSAGEIEARDAAARTNYDEYRRAKNPPYSSELIDPEEVNVNYPRALRIPASRIRNAGYMPDTGGFYSQLERVAEQKIKGRATPEQIRATLKNNGVKDDELNWVIGDLLARKQGGQITPEELRQEIAANRVELKENIHAQENRLSHKEAINKARSNLVEAEDAVHMALHEEGVESGEANRLVAEAKRRIERGDTDAREELQARFPKQSEVFATFSDSIARLMNTEGDNTASIRNYGVPKYFQYQLPGGANYKELVYSLPTAKPDKRYEARGNDVFDTEQNRVSSTTSSPEEAARRVAGMNKLIGEEKAPQFKSSHFDEPNIIFHARVNDRTTADGQNMLFAEEVQSDWHQKGRKAGYKLTDLPEGYSVEPSSDGQWQVNDKNHLPVSTPKWNGKAATAKEAKTKAIEALNFHGETVPNAPFKNEGWKRLALKKLIARAVAEGKDSIGWTEGKTQIDRYEEALRQNVDAIHYEPFKDDNGEQRYELLAYKNGKETFNEDNATIERINELLGKDIAAKITNNEGRDTKAEAPARDWRVLEGKDLSIGGEGMKGFYDRELVNIANDLGKKYGARVQKTILGGKRDFTPELDSKGTWNVRRPDGGWFVYEGQGEATKEAALEVAKDYERGFSRAGGKVNDPANTEVWQLPITPELKKAVAGGQALFMPDAPREFNEKEIRKAAPSITKAAQRVYDEWQQDESGMDEEFGAGGICDAIANEISGALNEAGWTTSPGGQEGDDHAYIIVTDGKKAYEVDIPPGVYESGGGYNWRKKEGVKFDESHILVNEVPLESVDPDILKEAQGDFMPDAKGRENTPDRTVRSNARVIPGALGEGIKKPKGALEEGLRKR